MRALLLVLALGGCSFVLTSSPPPANPPPTYYPSCMENPLPQIVDGAVAILATTGAIYFSQSSDKNANVGVVIESGIAIGFGLSALTTIHRPSRCRAARAAFQATLR